MVSALGNFFHCLSQTSEEMSAGVLAQNTWETGTSGAGIQESSPYIMSMSTWLGYMGHHLKQEEKEKRQLEIHG